MTTLFTSQNESRSVRSKGGIWYSRLQQPAEESTPPKTSAGKIYKLQQSGEMKKVTADQSGHQTRDQLETESDDGNSTDNAPRSIKGLPVFGPFYSKDNAGPILMVAREEAWRLVKHRTMEIMAGQGHRKTPDEIKQIYMTAMRNVEEEALDAYDGSLELGKTEFLKMMMEDGCFFLQLALVILGGAEALGLPSDHVLFGERQQRKNNKKWVNAMFFVGNQIPLVVLQELMKQSFFQEVLRRQKWDSPSAVSKKVLYKLLVVPALPSDQPSHQRGCLQVICCKGCRSMENKESNPFHKKQPCDVLDGLRSTILGPEIELEDPELDDIDLEANWKESITEDKRKISATSLKKAGIKIRPSSPAGGIRGIYFEEKFFSAHLYMPPFTVEEDAEMILQNLKSYEMNLPIGKNNRELCSYLRFMGDIICTLEDVKLLVKAGIIKGSQKERGKLPGILRRLDSKDLTQHLYNVKLEISSYSRPAWQLYLKQILSIVAFFTFVQTLYSVLGYHFPRSN